MKQRDDCTIYVAKTVLVTALRGDMRLIFIYCMRLFSHNGTHVIIGSGLEIVVVGEERLDLRHLSELEI